jgi:hypothetical protein
LKGKILHGCLVLTAEKGWRGAGTKKAIYISLRKFLLLLFSAVKNMHLTS